MPTIKLLPTQYDFVTDITTPQLLFVAGFGSGKTLASCYRAAYLATQNAPHPGLILSPTVRMSIDNLLPSLQLVLQQLDLPYSLVTSPVPSVTLHLPQGDTMILIRSLENFGRLRGLSINWCICDELDIVKQKIVEDAWVTILSRLRVGKNPTLSGASTPEGYSFCYNNWVVKADEDKRMIQARTLENPHLTDQFIKQLIQNYPPHLLPAYLNGEFVPLTTGRVYHLFDRNRNSTNLARPLEGYQILVGADFNVGKQAIAVSQSIGGCLHFFHEHTTLRDTPHMIQHVKERFPGFDIVIRPDASGNSVHTTDASLSDFTLIREAGLSLDVNASNPRIRDRVNSVQAALLNGEGEVHMYVNTEECPELTRGLEQQVWVDEKPDKSIAQDHVLDAMGYCCAREFPLNMLTTRQSEIRLF